MSGDEIFVLVGSLVVAGVAGLLWYAQLGAASLAPYPGRWRTWLAIAPGAAAAVVLATLLTLASYDVREAPQYLFLYVAFGLAWTFLAIAPLGWLGISFRDDAVERRNPAAAIVVLGAFAAHATIFAGANVGDGPGWWCVALAGLVGFGAWWLLWLGVELACGAAETVTVDRDVAAAIRLAGWMVGAGIICARGSAGDWTSWPHTLVEFRAAWPVLPLTAAFIGLERFALRRQGGAPGSMRLALLVAAACVVAGIAAIRLGPPLPQNPVYDAPAQGFAKPAAPEDPS